VLGCKATLNPRD